MVIGDEKNRNKSKAWHFYFIIFIILLPHLKEKTKHVIINLYFWISLFYQTLKIYSILDFLILSKSINDCFLIFFNFWMILFWNQLFFLSQLIKLKNGVLYSLNIIQIYEISSGKSEINTLVLNGVNSFYPWIILVA